MSGYNKGDKFIIELDEQVGDLWKIKGFNALVFDDFGLDRLGQLVQGVDKFSYHKGIEDAWGLVKFLELFSYEDLMELFGTDSYEDIYNMGYAEVAAKVEAWEKKKSEIRVGDVYTDGTSNLSYMVVKISDEVVGMLKQDGTHTYKMKKKIEKEYQKINHIDIESVLAKIK